MAIQVHTNMMFMDLFKQRTLTNTRVETQFPRLEEIAKQKAAENYQESQARSSYSNNQYNRERAAKQERINVEKSEQYIREDNLTRQYQQIQQAEQQQQSDSTEMQKQYDAEKASKPSKSAEMQKAYMQERFQKGTAVDRFA